MLQEFCCSVIFFFRSFDFVNIVYSMAKKNNQSVSHSSSSFKENDLVLAKMRGYCSWPARIVSIKNNTVRVYFFGEHNK